MTLLLSFGGREQKREKLKRKNCVSRFDLCFESWEGYIFSFLAYKILRAIVTLIFSVFLQSSISDRKFNPSQLNLFINDLFFVILCGFVFYLSMI